MKKYDDFLLEMSTTKKTEFDQEYDKLADDFYAFWHKLSEKLESIETINNSDAQKIFNKNQKMRKPSGTTAPATTTAATTAAPATTTAATTVAPVTTTAATTAAPVTKPIVKASVKPTTTTGTTTIKPAVPSKTILTAPAKP